MIIIFLCFYGILSSVVRMKKVILNKAIDLIKKDYPNYDQDKLDVIAYGLESIYLTITKMIIIFALAFLLNIVKEVIFLLVSYNIIRTTAFGLHATKSIYCLITSLLFFVVGAIMCKTIVISSYLKITLSLISFICLTKYAPADTYKRPLINAKKRKKFKILTIISGFIYVILIIYFRNNVISNYILVGMIEATLLIHPLVYKVFNLPYDNYKKYDSSLVEV